MNKLNMISIITLLVLKLRSIHFVVCTIPKLVINNFIKSLANATYFSYSNLETGLTNWNKVFPCRLFALALPYSQICSTIKIRLN